MLIREAELELAPGLNAITGETGAGKTILAQALGCCSARGRRVAIGPAARRRTSRRSSTCRRADEAWASSRSPSCGRRARRRSCSRAASSPTGALVPTRGGAAWPARTWPPRPSGLIAMSGQFEQRRLARPPSSSGARHLRRGRPVARRAPPGAGSRPPARRWPTAERDAGRSGDRLARAARARRGRGRLPAGRGGRAARRARARPPRRRAGRGRVRGGAGARAGRGRGRRRASSRSRSARCCRSARSRRSWPASPRSCATRTSAARGKRRPARVPRHARGRPRPPQQVEERLDAMAAARRRFALHHLRRAARAPRGGACGARRARCRPRPASARRGAQPTPPSSAGRRPPPRCTSGV